MQNMIKQEQFELEVLEKLNSGRLLDNLLFGGGTMLRLCHGLNRYSIDLDFWMIPRRDGVNPAKLFKEMGNYLRQNYTVKDSSNKFYTLLYEIKSGDYPQSLKIEIRKEIKKVKVEKAIAYSKNSNIQVLLNTVSLTDMMKAKIEAFLNRKEIRDVFDIEFLFKKGIDLPGNKDTFTRILKEIELLKKKDYSVKLGSLLEKDQRKYYTEKNFAVLKNALIEKLNGG